MGWLGRSTIVSASAHRPSSEELGLHDGEPAPERTGLAALQGRKAWESPRTFDTGHVRGWPGVENMSRHGMVCRSGE